MRCIARYTQWRSDAIAQVLAAASASAAAAAASASVSITASVAASASAASISAAALLTANLSANATAAVATEAATCGPSWETPWARVSYATIPDDDVSWWRTSYGAHATCMLECVVAEYLVWQLFKLERGTLIEETYLNLTLVFFVRCALTHVVTARELVLVAYSTATLAVAVLFALLAVSWAIQHLGRSFQRPALRRVGAALLTHTDRLPELCALYMLAAHARNRAIVVPLFAWTLVFYWHAIGFAPDLMDAIKSRSWRAFDAARGRCARLGVRAARFLLTPLARRGAERLAALRRRVLCDDDRRVASLTGYGRFVRRDVAPELASGSSGDDDDGDDASDTVADTRPATVAAKFGDRTDTNDSEKFVSPHAISGRAMLSDIRAHVRTVPRIAAWLPRRMHS
jgi:hypothetical protein